MKAITTRYLGPTNRRGARIKASDGDGNTATVSYPYHLSGERCHFEAVRELCRRLGWCGRLTWGGIHNGYVWVWLPDDTTTDVFEV